MQVVDWHDPHDHRGDFQLCRVSCVPDLNLLDPELNFEPGRSYAFTEALLVTPLGALSVVVWQVPVLVLAWRARS